MKDRGLIIERRAKTAADPQAWKRLMGNQSVDARLETLPDNKIRPSAFAVSSSVQVVLALALISLPLFFPEKLSLRMVYQVTPIEAPQTEVPVQPEPPPVRPKSAPAPVRPVEPIRVAKLFVPQPLIAPKPKPPERQNSEVPKLDPVLAAAKFNTSM